MHDALDLFTSSSRLPPSSLLSMWPDSGPTRNTRPRSYRCSVPGLAGFAGDSVVRSPKSDKLSIKLLKFQKLSKLSTVRAFSITH
jgi:hypothetical protein